MLKRIAKVAENCAKKTSSQACPPITAILHQPKMPKSLIKKD